MSIKTIYLNVENASLKSGGTRGDSPVQTALALRQSGT